VSLNFFISKFVTPIFKVLLNDKIFEIIKNKYNHYFFPILAKFYIIKSYKHKKEYKLVYLKKRFEKINNNLIKLNLSQKKLKKYDYI